MVSKRAVMKANGIPNYVQTRLSTYNLEYFDDVNSIPGTTGPGIPKAIRSALSKKYGGVNTGATESYGAAK
ncbi:unnamed protein product, partial [Rotaria sp. Silwood1]